MRTLGIALLLLLPALAAADMPERPWYVGLDALGVHLSDDDAFPDADSNKGGVRLYGGYLGPNRWAGEISLVALGRYDTGAADQRARFSAVAVSAVRHWPVSDTGRLFLRLGIGGMEVDVNGDRDSAGMITIGVGGELQLPSGVFFRGGLDLYGASLEPDPASDEDFSFGLSALGIGIGYAF